MQTSSVVGPYYSDIEAVREVIYHQILYSYNQSEPQQNPQSSVSVFQYIDAPPHISQTSACLFNEMFPNSWIVG